MINELTLKEDKAKRLNELQSKLDLKKKTALEQIENKYNTLLSTANEEEKSSLLTNKEKEIEALNKKFELKYKKAEKREDSHIKSVLRLSKRIFEVDLLRGIVIWGMIIDHTIFNFSDKGFFKDVFNFHGYGTLGWVEAFRGFCTPFYDSEFRIGVRLFGIFALFMLTGISSSFSKSNIRRGLLLTGFGVLITVILNIFAVAFSNPGLHMLMCIITTLGLAILIYNGSRILFDKLHEKYEDHLFKVGKRDNLTIESGKLVHTKSQKGWVKTCIIVTISLLALWVLVTALVYCNSPYTAYEVAHGAPEGVSHTFVDYLSHFYLIFNGDGNFIGWDRIGTDIAWSNLDFVSYLKIIFGVRGFGFDWLGLFPFVAYTFLGGLIGNTIYKDKKSIIYYFTKEDRTNPNYLETKAGQLNLKLNMKLSFITYPGKHTLLIYIFHQPAITIFFGLIFLMLGATLNV